MKNILILFVGLLAFSSCTKKEELIIKEPISDTVQCVVESIKSNPNLWSLSSYDRTELFCDSFNIRVIFSEIIYSNLDAEMPMKGFISFDDIDCSVNINSSEENLMAKTYTKYILEPLNKKRLEVKAYRDSLASIKLQAKLKLICNK